VSPLLPFFPLTSTFFGLTSDYRAWWEEELFVCRKHIGWSYDDLMRMPINSRRYQIHLLKNENKARDEHYQEKLDEVRSKSTGTRTRRVSGDELKAKIKRGEVD
jgi:hypothetical protein